MNLREPGAAGEGERGGEIFIGLTGEPDDDVRGDRRAVEGVAEAVHGAAERVGGVPAVHAP